MKNLIVCFSGTGNTYYVASKIAETLEDCKIEMVNNISRENFVMPERLGIFSPTHVSVEPRIISQFISDILGESSDKETLKYVYSISTAASNILLWGNKRVEKELKNVGITLSYANNVQMPSNYFPKSIDEVNKKRIEKSDIKINQVIEELKEEKFRLAKWRPKLLGFIFYLL
ncbi:MAG: flavodoxin family protein, partial [Spirochaetaceae bacterium]|nr:flavodoxin family protein [Spirochaetaceae bacterium]